MTCHDCSLCILGVRDKRGMSRTQSTL
jgi:hypothetical protein